MTGTNRDSGHRAGSPVLHSGVVAVSAAPAGMETAAQAGLVPSAMLPMIGPGGAADYCL